jgi:hypothetical protein
MIATQPAPGAQLLKHQTVFLYLGAADATVKPEFLRNLRGPAVPQFPSHRTVRLNREDLRSALRSSSKDGFERIIAISDIEGDDQNHALDVIIHALSGEQRSLGKLRSLEFFLALKSESDLQQVICRLSPLVQESSTSPHLKFYLLIPSSTGTIWDKMVRLITAMTMQVPSRMELIGDGVSAIRGRDESFLFVVQYDETPLPIISQIAPRAVNKALWVETFSFAAEQGHLSQPPAGIEQLLAAHNVGIDEPPVTSVDFALRRSFYRDALLHPIACRLLRSFPDEPAFLDGIQRVAKQLQGRSEAARSLLSDFRNALISARVPGSSWGASGQYFDAKTMRIISGLVKPLVRQYRFPIWPLLGRELRPSQNANTLRTLYEEYDRLVGAAAEAMRDGLEKEIRVRQEATKKLLIQQAGRLRGNWKLPPSSFIYVHQDISGDRRDEIWPYQDRCGFLELLQMESRS